MAIDPRIPMMGEATPFESPFETQRNALALRQAQTQMQEAGEDRMLEMLRKGREVLASSYDEPSYQRGLQTLQRLGIPTNDMPRNFDANYVASEGKALLTFQQRLEMQRRQLFQQDNRLLAASPYTGEVEMIYEGPQAPPKPVEPRLSEVVDPKNRNRRLRVNINEYVPGGSLGDPGVYGVSEYDKPPAGGGGAVFDPNEVKHVITDESGNVRMFNARGAQIAAPGDIGRPSAAYERTQAQRAQMKQDIDSTISELKNAVKPNGLIEESTGSGAGAAADAVAGFFGYATPGAIAVGSLQPIYDKVLKMVPRFEGPQSDKDTQSYREAAGQIANPAVPKETKLAAAKTILRLMEARRDQFTTQDAAAGGDGGASGVDTNNPLLK